MTTRFGANAHHMVPVALSNASAKIAGLGTANPPVSYSQAELLDLFAIKDRRVRSLFLNSSIERRYLTLPPLCESGTLPVETQGELLEKHRACAISIGTQALQSCLECAQATPSDIAYLCCVTTTGFLCPGLTAIFCHELRLSPNCGRLDIVGMGCNAGLNGLNAVSNWALANPGKLAIMLCIEICSAAYVIDGSMRTSVVNSLFGDGAAAMAVIADGDCEEPRGPAFQKFHSSLDTTALSAMRYDWDESHGKFSFFLHPEIPYIIGKNVERTISELLTEADVRRSDIDHWIIHSGGKKVIDSIRVNLGLSAHDLRHTTSVLRDYGNVSSSSFIFTLQRLLNEDGISRGDYGVIITMGPGLTIESALLHW